ncbi:MAG: sodium:proton antiporter [Armatimonas sp.]
MGIPGSVEILLLVAALVAMLARRLRLPYTVGLLGAGVGLALARAPLGLKLTQELIFQALLPPLLFEAAFFIEWEALKKDLKPVLTLATVGVLLAASVVAGGMHFLAGWPLPAAAVFGALIAATDPVSVIATFKDAGVHGRVRLLVEAESLINDGVAAVVFGVALLWATGAGLSAGGAALMLLREAGGGVLCGLLVGGILLFLAGKTEDHLIEITFTTIAAFGSFLLAQKLHCSGVLSTLVCGLLIGNYGSLGSLTDKGREAVGSFWEWAAFVANSLVFLLIGTRLASIPLGPSVKIAAIAVLISLLGRAIAVYPLAAPFKIPIAEQHVLFWGGLRGALGLALALGLPDSMPHRDEILAVTFLVVAFSIVVQGITFAPLLRRLGLLDAPD